MTPPPRSEAPEPDRLAPPIEIVGLGRIGYAEGLDRQREHHAEVLGAREFGDRLLGRVLVLEHDPVITVTRRASASGHVLAPPEALSRAGIEVHETDRGGDVTYHGPGQLVVYPIIDLKRLGLGLHDHIRLMEAAVIEALASLGVEGRRDEGATGVWLPDPGGGPDAKVCAMGVRVRRWVTLHGLALNVSTDLSHFAHIVPCGLAGRPVTSLREHAGVDDWSAARDAVIAALMNRWSARLAGRG